MIRKASLSDTEKIVSLVNSAYRGASSKQGWTTEADLLDGQRVDPEMIQEIISSPKSSIFIYSLSDHFIGCVLLESHPDSFYLGMLTVHPDYQKQKIGDTLLQWAESKAKSESKKFIEISVITERTELIAYYERRHYFRTGKTLAFPQDPRYGIPKKAGLRMETFQKQLFPQTPLAIKATELGRTYRSYKKSEGVLSSIKGFWKRDHIDVPALQPTSFEIAQGQIVGLVGANGAGKTTLLKTLSGLIHPTSGDAQVLGFRPWERKNDFLRKISLLLGQKNQLWWDISPADSFELLGKIYEIDKSDVKKRVDELSDVLACSHVLHVQLRRLSLGERMKMELIGALLHEPQILFLDEPTIGLDIVAQTAIRKFLERYVREKKPTIILTSHYMDDITELADRLLLMSKGSLVYDGSVKDFISASDKSTNQEADFESVIRQFLEKESRV